MTDGLKNVHREAIIATIAANDRVERAVLFGSRATETNTVSSDVDIALFGNRLTLTDQARLAAALDEIPLAQSVDLLLYDSIRDRTLREHIRRQGVEWYAGPNYEGTGCDGSSAANTWPILSLRQAGVSLIDCEHRTPPASEDGYPYVGIPQIKDGRIDLDGARCISHEHFREWTRRASPQPFDIVLSRRCNPGDTGFVSPDFVEFALGQNLVLLRSNGEEVLKPFLRWLVRSPQWWTQVSKYINVGAVFDSLKCVDIPGFRLPVPPLPDQRAIAHILGTLDDKIELNRRMNATLEAMVRALFRSWFVDFDPVRAKMGGRDTGLPKEVADLFPDRLVDSALGEIPDGWGVSEIGTEVDAVGGGTPSTKEPAYWTGGRHCWATPKDLSKLSSPALLGTDRKITDAGVQKISSGLLPRGTVLLSSRAPIGYLAITGVPTAVNQGFIAMICRKRLPALYVLSWCRESLEHIKDISGGSTFAEISKKTFRPLPVLVPPKRVLGVYHEASRSLHDSVVSNTRESALLASLRDALLPRLVSGELRVDGLAPESGSVDSPALAGMHGA